MKEGNYNLKNILNLLKEHRGFDFSGYRPSMLERRLQKRIYTTKNKNHNDYLEYLKQNPDELDNLIDAFTINVSRFFRNSLSFEHIRKNSIPELILAKEKENDKSLRVWSAACSFGEEAYSMAIIMNEIIENENKDFNLSIFATDIDKKAIKRAIKGIYNFESVKNVKYGSLEKYFTINGGQFIIDAELKKKVQFSFYDLLDEKRLVPPESIFGGFDIVLCRNVLIYFNLDYQRIIFNKLYKSLNPGGYLILGEAEVPIEKFKRKFKRVSNCCKIYKKLGD